VQVCRGEAISVVDVDDVAAIVERVREANDAAVHRHHWLTWASGEIGPEVTGGHLAVEFARAPEPTGDARVARKAERRLPQPRRGVTLARHRQRAPALVGDSGGQSAVRFPRERGIHPQPVDADRARLDPNGRGHAIYPPLLRAGDD
jgi:hypothetical protein